MPSDTVLEITRNLDMHGGGQCVEAPADKGSSFEHAPWLYTRRLRNDAFSMLVSLGSVSRMGIKVDQEPHSQSTVGTMALQASLPTFLSMWLQHLILHCVSRPVPLVPLIVCMRC
jgi:hypothetical protein